MNTTTLPQDVMTSSLLHFENGVPIDDLKLREDQKKRLLRVQHVYWQWIRNPFLDTRAMFRQMVKGHYCDNAHECRVAQRDHLLFEFIKESVAPMSRKDAQRKVQVAAEKAIQIGMETDNVMALTKGGKLLYEVAGLDKPEDNRADMNKVAFLQPVVTTVVTDVDSTKIDYTDEQSRSIMQEFGAYIDPKREMIEEKVAAMEAAAGPSEEAEYTEETE